MEKILFILSLLLLFGVCESEASITFGRSASSIGYATISDDATVTGEQDDAGSITTSMTVGSGSNSILIVSITTEDSTATLTVDNITYNGIGMTYITRQLYDNDGGGNDNNVEIWYLLNPSTGANDIVATLDDTVDSITLLATSHFGVAQTAPEASVESNMANAVTTTATVDITSITDGALIVDSAATSSSNYDQTPGAGQTELAERSNGSRHNIGKKPMPTAGLTSMTWTHTAQRSGIVAAAFKPAEL